MQTEEEPIVAVPIDKANGLVYADLSGFCELIVTSAAGKFFIVIPSSNDGLSYLRFATHLYSKLVVLGKPCLDVAIRRLGAENTMSGASYGNLVPAMQPSKTSSRTVLHSGSASPVHSVPVGSEGYKFGDGSVDFYGKYGVVAVGGTFDRLHAGHRLLLTAAAWAARDKLRIGITSQALLKRKKFRQLIASFEERSKSATEFARRVKPPLPQITISELTDPAGPSATDPSIDALVVSSETAAGVEEINDRRAKAGLRRMAVIEVDVLDTQGTKLSSSALREAEVVRGTGN